MWNLVDCQIPVPPSVEVRYSPASLPDHHGAAASICTKCCVAFAQTRSGTPMTPDEGLRAASDVTLVTATCTCFLEPPLLCE